MIGESARRQVLVERRARVACRANALNALFQLTMDPCDGEARDARRQTQREPGKSRFEQRDVETSPRQEQRCRSARWAAANDDDLFRFGQCGKDSPDSIAWRRLEWPGRAASPV